MVDLHRKRPSTILSITKNPPIWFGTTRPQVLMPGVGHRVCRCWTPNNTFCVPCHAGWQLQPSRKAEKLYMKAEMQKFDKGVSVLPRVEFLFKPFSSILKYWKADLPRWLPIFWGFCRKPRHLDTWTENIFSCRASASIDSDFQCRHPAASSRAPLKGVAGHFWFTNEMTFNKTSLFKFIHWGLVLFFRLSFMHMISYDEVYFI